LLLKGKFKKGVSADVVRIVVRVAAMKMA